MFAHLCLRSFWSRSLSALLSFHAPSSSICLVRATTKKTHTTSIQQTLLYSFPCWLRLVLLPARAWMPLLSMDYQINRYTLVSRLNLIKASFLCRTSINLFHIDHPLSRSGRFFVVLRLIVCDLSSIIAFMSLHLCFICNSAFRRVESWMHFGTNSIVTKKRDSFFPLAFSSESNLNESNHLLLSINYVNW